MKPLKVTEVNNYIKKMFAGDIILSNIEVEGEISNYRPHYSGHLYFSLKDEMGRIKCVMFKSYADRCGVQLLEGQKIIVKGYISIYEKNGDYQLYVKDIINKGVGQLYREYEELKARLEAEGLFKQEFKKNIPFMPNKIGVVTSSTGAAIRDIVTIVQRRFPPCNILIYPSLVQGTNAPYDIIEGLLYLDSRQDIDLIIVGRGGGSIDELFAFNDEKLARTIFGLNAPIISAVGHETDFTIADFVSDLRAPTPSAAAELSVPDIGNLRSVLHSRYRNLKREYERWMKLNLSQLEMVYRAIKYNNPAYKMRDKSQELDMLFKELCSRMEGIINSKYNSLFQLEKKLQLLNPTISLEKGHGILLDEEGYPIRSVEDMRIEDRIRILMKDGSIKAVIEEIEDKRGNEEYEI